MIGETIKLILKCSAYVAAFLFYFNEIFPYTPRGSGLDAFVVNMFWVCVLIVAYVLIAKATI